LGITVLKAHAPIAENMLTQMTVYMREQAFDKVPKHHFRILLRYCNKKLGREDISKLTI
jgi:hypothetical protein